MLCLNRTIGRIFAHDAIAYNHNGVVNVTTVDNAGAPAPALVPQTISVFQAYASDPSPLIRAHALRYYLNGREPYSKYAMPEIMFRVNAGNVVLGPAEPQGAGVVPVHIITTQPFRQNPTVQAGNDGILPFQNGDDYNNLQQVIANYRASAEPENNVMIDGPPRTLRATIKIRSYENVCFMYSFPNFY